MRVYLVGAGVIARTHVEAAQKLDIDIEFRVADVSRAMLDDFATVYPLIPRFSSVDEMLSSESAADDDIVVVATPPFAHLEPTLAAFSTGRHVLCEKPLAMTVDEAERMLAAANDAGKQLGCCSVRFRGLPHTQTVKRAIATGVLGKVYHLSWINKWFRSRSGIEYQPQSRWFLDSTRSGGGVLMDWGPYDIATLTDLFDPRGIEISGAFVARPETTTDPVDVVFDVETAAGASLVLIDADGGRMAVDFQRASGTQGEEVFRAELEGTAASLRWTPFDSQAPVILRIDRGDGVVEEVVEPEPREPYSVFDYPLFHFTNAVRGLPNRANLGERAVDHFRWIRAFYDAAADGRARRVDIQAQA